MKRTSLITAAALIAVASTSVLATASGRDADNRRGPERGAMMFERFDLNKDGQVTREEVTTAAAAHFAEADANNDGQLSAEEMTAAAEAKANEQRAARMANRTADMIKRQDTNGDGQLSLEELTAIGGEDRMERMFDRLDADDDGTITKAELEDMDGKRGGHGRGGERHGRGHN